MRRARRKRVSANAPQSLTTSTWARRRQGESVRLEQWQFSHAWPRTLAQRRMHDSYLLCYAILLCLHNAALSGQSMHITISKSANKLKNHYYRVSALSLVVAALLPPFPRRRRLLPPLPFWLFLRAPMRPSVRSRTLRMSAYATI